MNCVKDEPMWDVINNFTVKAYFTSSKRSFSTYYITSANFEPSTTTNTILKTCI